MERDQRRVADVAGRQQEAAVVGLFGPSYFRTGDLIGLEADNLHPMEALPVAARDADSLPVGVSRIALGANDVPLVGDEKTQRYAKLRPAG